MTKYEYIGALEQALSPMPYAEKIKILDFYREMIEDKLELGATEDEVIAELGDIGALAARLLEEYNETNVGRAEEEQSKNDAPKASSGGLKVALVVTIILASPIILALLAAAVSIIFAVGAAAVSVGIALIAAAIGVAVAGIFVFGTAFAIIGASFFGFILRLGVSFLLIAASVLLFSLGVLAVKLLFGIIRAIFDAIKARRKRGSAK